MPWFGDLVGGGSKHQFDDITYRPVRRLGAKLRRLLVREFWYTRRLDAVWNTALELHDEEALTSAAIQIANRQ